MSKVVPKAASPGGINRSPGISWTQLMSEDARPVPEFLRQESYTYRGSEPLSADRYTSPDFMRLEQTKMWPYVWQFAAREEDMPGVADYIVYENAGRSYVVTRQDDGSVRAFHNVCLHRGRKLRTQDGTADHFQCPFHGFTWNKNGSIKKIPCRWDFSHLQEEKMHLPEAEVARWGGYIFIRENAGGPSLEEFLAPLPEHFERWKHEQCTTAIWVAKVVPANWKVTSEAFMEAWHTVVTHPQLLPFTGDENSAYWTWGDNVNVNLVPFGVMSPHIDANGKTQQWIVDQFVKFNGRSAENYEGAPHAEHGRPGEGGPGSTVSGRMPAQKGAGIPARATRERCPASTASRPTPAQKENEDAFAVKVPPGMTARRALGAAMRENYTKMFGHDHSEATDSELLDALVYNVFPNFAPWGGFMPNIVYRWRPWKDPDHCLMEVRILTRVPPGQPIPHGVPMKFLTDEQPWTAAPELGVLGAVFEQDMANLPYVQEGLHASKNGQINLGDFQEIRIRQFHQTLDKYLSRP